jgi:hypothetical protein
MSLNINQFAQTTIRGQLDQNIPPGPVIAGVVSVNQATALKAGDAVKLDTSTGNVPSFVAAAASDVAIGHLVFDEKKASPVAGDAIQVALFGSIMWMTARGTVAVQASLENYTDGTVQTLASAKMRGIALDPATTGNLLRVIIRDVTPS